MAGIVGPLGSGGLSLPGVERAMKEMERTSSPSASRPTLLSNREYSSSNVPSSSSALVDPSASAGGVGVASPLQSPSIGANGQPVASTEALVRPRFPLAFPFPSDLAALLPLFLPNLEFSQN
jgi:hypothetical protein